eukprot:ctg_659.g305
MCTFLGFGILIQIAFKQQRFKGSYLQSPKQYSCGKCARLGLQKNLSRRLPVCACQSFLEEGNEELRTKVDAYKKNAGMREDYEVERNNKEHHLVPTDFDLDADFGLAVERTLLSLKRKLSDEDFSCIFDTSNPRIGEL